MSAFKKMASPTGVLADNPLDGEEYLREAMFGPVAAPARAKPSAPRLAERPDHYRIVSISLYVEDIERLEKMVLELKARGHHRANKSQLIRHALNQVDLDRIPKG